MSVELQASGGVVRQAPPLPVADHAITQDANKECYHKREGSLGFDYPRYLASRPWALLREAVRVRSGNHCERCFTGPQDAVHHRTYERIGHEDLSDLQAICGPCHDFVSGKSDIDPAAIYINTMYSRLTNYIRELTWHLNGASPCDELSVISQRLMDWRRWHLSQLTPNEEADF